MTVYKQRYSNIGCTIMYSMTASFVILTFLYVTGTKSVIPDLNVVVVEYQPVIQSKNYTADDNINADHYVNILNGLKGNNDSVDLVIFPESTLNAHFINILDLATLVRIGENPCDDLTNTTYPQYMQKLSCAARNISAHLVINTIEKQPCPNLEHQNCIDYGYYLYNTDVIFDDSGKIVQRYRKRNLFGEYPLNTPTVTDNTTVSINSVKLGIFTCFDLLFKHPAQDLVESGIENFIFPTMWFSELPFLTSLQAQQMWAMRHKVNLYAAGANGPERGSGGTSIIDGSSGPIVMDIISGDGGSKAYTKNSKSIDDIHTLSKSMDSFHLLTDDNITDYNSLPIDNWTSPLDQKLCHGDFCCQFHISSSGNSASTITVDAKTKIYFYHLIAYSGIRSFGGTYNGGIEICGVIACLNSSLSSCGLRFPDYDSVLWDRTFLDISINLETTSSLNKTHYGSSLLSSIRPLHPSLTHWSIENDREKIRVGFQLIQPQSNLLTFAIYGRNFELDHAPLPLV